VLDREGQPTLYPSLSDLVADAPEKHPDRNRSFLRALSYAPFNGHYQRREPERAVLSMGSVLY